MRPLLRSFQTNALSWFTSLKIVVKLRVAFALLAASTAIVGLGSLWTMTLLNDRVETAYQQDLPVVSAIKEAANYQLKAKGVLFHVVLDAGDDDSIDKENSELLTYLTKERAELDASSSKLRSESGKAKLDQARKMLPGFEQGAKQIVTEAKAADIIGFRNTIKDLVPYGDRMQALFDQVSQITEAQAAKSKMLATLTYLTALAALIPTVVGAGIIAAFLSFVMSSIIATPIARTVRVLEAVAKGDLTQSLPANTTDEMGQLAKSLNHALASLRGTLSKVSQSSQDLRGASRSLASTAARLANGAAEQAAGLEATTTSLERVSLTIRETASHTAEANELGAAARRAADKGDASVTLAIAAMQEIRHSSDQISTIVAAINDLAFQSNMLSLNASIEAARAGEEGRGFAVVATEIRDLALRSKESALQIERLVNNSLERVEKGASLVNGTGKALAEITDSVKNLSKIVNEIASASMGVEYVTEAMNKVDGVVKANTSQTKDVSSTADQLAALAEDLNDTLTHFVFEGR